MAMPVNEREVASLQHDIYGVAQEIRSLFALYLENPRVHQNLIKQCQYRFLTWSSFLGVFAAPSASLDARLRESPDAKDLVLSMLTVVKRNLIRGIERHHSGPQMQLGADEHNPDPVIRGITGALDRLHRLAVAIRQPARTDEVARVQAFTKKRCQDGFEDIALAVVNYLFGGYAPPSLCVQLAKSIVYRRNRLLYQREHNRKLGKYRAETKKDSGLDASVPSNDRGPQTLEHRLMEIERPPASQTDLSPTEPSKRDYSNIRHILSSQNNRDESKPTTSSIRSSNPSIAARYPRKPPVQDGQVVTLCPYCWNTILASDLASNRWWKSHVDNDLKLYICISEKCGNLPPYFSTAGEWGKHMHQEHQDDWAQRIHCEFHWLCLYDHGSPPHFPTEQSLRAHLAELHGRQFRSEGEMDAIAKRSKQSTVSEAGVCPLCGLMVDVPAESEDEGRELKVQQGKTRKKVSFQDEEVNPIHGAPVALAQTSNSEFGMQATSATLRKHIAEHLKSVAFVSLRWWDEDAGSNEAASRNSIATGSIGSGADKDDLPLGSVFLEESTIDQMRRIQQLLEEEEHEHNLSESEDQGRSTTKDHRILTETLHLDEEHSKDAATHSSVSEKIQLKVDHGLLLTSKILGGQEFLPEDQINNILTRATIENILKEAQISPEPYVDFVLQHARKVFLILVYIDRVDTLYELHAHGFDDSALPVIGSFDWDTQQRAAPKVVSWDNTNSRSKKDWQCFRKWRYRYSRLFERCQWLFLAPTLTHSEFFYDIHKSCPLPLLDRHDGFPYDRPTKVVKLDVRSEQIQSPVALKFCRIKSEETLSRDREFLLTVRTIDHPHLIRPIAMLRRGESSLSIYPWAEGGNMLKFWREKDDMREQLPLQTAAWALKQMCGLSDCLRSLHEQKHHHGDLKPENILHFEEDGENGRLVIAGLLSDNKPDMLEFQEVMIESPYRYAGPELGREHDGPILTRHSDIWSLGCIFLEFAIWLVNGWKYLEYFRNDNGWESKSFWDSKDGVTRTHPNVQREMSRLLSNADTFPIIKAVVILIRDKLLVAHDWSHGTRATAQELSNSLDTLMRRARDDLSYLQQQSETISASPDAHKGYQEIVTPSNEGSGELVSTLQRTRSDVIPSARGNKNLIDGWEFTTDNSFAMDLFRRIDYSNLLPSSIVSRFCSSCQSIDFSTPSFEWPYDLRELQSRASQCDFCRLCQHSLEEAGVHNDTGKLIRVGSTLKSGHKGPPIISIYGQPGSIQPSKQFPQLGFPILPGMASPQQYELFRQWLRVCDESHDCNTPIAMDGPPEIPTRLIDVGELAHPTLRLVDSDIHIWSRYIALSYRWGSAATAYCARRSNIKNLTQHIEYSSLPGTIQDTIYLTRILGVRYLWVDTLCILQDDFEDWRKESLKMASVYHLAYCIVSASSATSPQDRIFASRTPREYVTKLSSTGHTLHLCKNIDNFQVDVEESILNTRGWALQNRILSKRTIHFTANQVYWECGQGIRCETLGQLRDPVAALIGDPRFPTSILPYSKGDRIVLLQHLYRIYTRCHFLRPEDRAVALLEVEKRIGAVLHTRAGHGLIEEYLEMTLLWQRSGKHQVLARIEFTNGQVPSWASSWSWTSYSGDISYLSAPFNETDWCRDHIEYHSEGIQSSFTGPERAELRALVSEMALPSSAWRSRVIRDNEDDGLDDSLLRCVSLGVSKEPADNEEGLDCRTHYVLFVKLEDGENECSRVGVGSVLAHHIAENPPVWMTVI